MTETKIQWCDFSSNLLKYRDVSGKAVWACAKVSDGCKNCYSETLAHRYRKGGPFTLQQVKKATPFFDDKEAALLLRSKKLTGKRVFIDDMTDLFGEWVPDEIIDKHFAVFALRPDVTFQVLTKRPERTAEYLECRSGNELGVYDRAGRRSTTGGLYPVVCAASRIDPRCDLTQAALQSRWPLPNVWLGTSCENQQTADERIPHLLNCPAAVRFLSCEPLLGGIDLSRTLLLEPSISWVIVGCESRGNYAGRFTEGYEQAAQSIIDQCAAAGVACFHKQNIVGNRVSGEMSEWAPALRVRQMPTREATTA